MTILLKVVFRGLELVPQSPWVELPKVDVLATSKLVIYNKSNIRQKLRSNIVVFGIGLLRVFQAFLLTFVLCLLLFHDFLLLLITTSHLCSVSLFNTA